MSRAIANSGRNGLNSSQLTEMVIGVDPLITPTNEPVLIDQVILLLSQLMGPLLG